MSGRPERRRHAVEFPRQSQIVPPCALATDIVYNIFLLLYSRSLRQLTGHGTSVLLLPLPKYLICCRCLDMSSSVLGWDSPAPTGNRFAVVTPDNHSAWIWLPTLLALVYSFCFLVFRGIVKLKRYGADDAIIVVAYVFALCHWITTFVALHNGLGRSSLFLKDAQEQSVSKNLFAGRIFLLIALCLSKCAIILLIRQVFTHELKTAWQTCNISLGILAAWCLLAVVASSAGCSAEHVLAKDDSSLCPNQKIGITLEAHHHS